MLIIRKAEDEYRTNTLYVSRPINMAKFLTEIKKRLCTNKGSFADNFSDKIIKLVCFKGINLQEEYKYLYSNEIDSFENFLYKIKLLDKKTISILTDHSSKNGIFEIQIAKIESYPEQNLFSEQSRLVENLNKGLEDIND